MMFADKARVPINFPTAWAQTDFGVKGVYQAQSCLGCAEAAFAVYKNKICRLPPWLSDAVERPKSEPRPDPLRLNRRVLSECAVVRPESRLYSKLGCQTDPSERTLGRIGCTSDRCGFRSEVPPR
jgi:hypothetical protein